MMNKLTSQPKSQSYNNDKQKYTITDFLKSIIFCQYIDKYEPNIMVEEEKVLFTFIDNEKYDLKMKEVVNDIGNLLYLPVMSKEYINKYFNDFEQKTKEMNLNWLLNWYCKFKERIIFLTNFANLKDKNELKKRTKVLTLFAKELTITISDWQTIITILKTTIGLYDIILYVNNHNNNMSNFLLEINSEEYVKILRLIKNHNKEFFLLKDNKNKRFLFLLGFIEWWKKIIKKAKNINRYY